MEQPVIRQEEQKDHPAVFKLIQQAFESEALSDHKEQFLVERLRQSSAFIPELSIVAEQNNRVVGYILLTRITIQTEKQTWNSLALAPVAVSPSHQGKGIGGELIQYAHKQAKTLGEKSVVLLGHAHYYPRFGYKTADSYQIQLPFEAPSENCMAVELIEGGLDEVQGIVHYPAAFFE